MTAALEVGEWSAARPDRTLPQGRTLYPFYRRLGGPQGRSGRAENLVPTGIRSLTVQPVVSRYTDWATLYIYILLIVFFYPDRFLVIMFLFTMWYGVLKHTVGCQTSTLRVTNRRVCVRRLYSWETACYFGQKEVLGAWPFSCALGVIASFSLDS